MKKIKLNFKYIFMFIILFVVLFHNNNVFANADVKDIDFKLTFYDDDINPTGSGHTPKDFTVNEEHGWFEYEQDGIKYVVIAAATEELLESGEVDAERQDYIHYFKYNDIIKFKFEDESYDSKEYYGIILDSCGASMDVGLLEEQILDIYVPKNGDYSKCESFNQKVVFVSDDGTFSNKAGKSKKEKSFFLNLFTNIFSGLADIINTWINDTTKNVKSPQSLALVGSRAQIETYDQLKEELQITDYNQTVKTDAIATINISNQVDGEDGKKETVYTPSTKIPMIYTDIYTSSIDTVNLLDINFFAKNYNSNSAWKVVRNLVNAFSHGAMFIAIGLLIVMLILRAITFISTSLTDNPAGAKESKDIINSLIKSTFLIVGIYIFMTLMIGLYKLIMSLVVNANESIFLIRLVVDNVYAFNTNIIGYIKFLSLRSNEWAAFGYSVIYFLYTLMNAVWFLFMFLRVLIIGLLVIIAPLTAVATMRGNTPREGTHVENIIHFKNWVKVFMVWLWVPIIAVIIIRIILHII